MKFRILLLALVTALSLASVAAADPGIPDTVRLDSVQVDPGDKFSMPIFLYNDEQITGGTLGFSWGDADLFLDSVSAVGSRLAVYSAGLRPVTINNTDHTVLTGFIWFPFDPAFNAGSGLWSTLWFTVAPGASDKVITLDSAFIPPSGDFLMIGVSENIVPQYVPGKVVIGNPSSNTAPTLNPIANQSVNEGANLNFNVSANDAESTPTLSATGVPAFGSFNDNGDGTGTFNFNPGFANSGVYPITVIASDGELADTANFNLTVNNVNRAPVWNPVAAQNVNEGANLSFGITSTDPDGNPLTLSHTGLPANAGLTDNGNGTGTVTFNPDFTQAGGYTFTFITSDGTLADTVDVSVTVNNVNRPPVLSPVAGGSVDVGNTFSEGISATDPDGDPITLTLSAPITNAVLTDNGDGTGLFEFTPDVSQAGQSFNRMVIASDGTAADSAAFTVSVNNVSAPDSANVSPDTLFFTATEGDTDPLNGCAFLTSTNAPANFIGALGTGDDIISSFTDIGGTDDSVCVTVDPSGLSAGTYQRVINYTVSNVENNPQVLTVVLTVEPGQVDETADINPDSLVFVATFGESGLQSGCATLTSTNAPANFTAILGAGDAIISAYDDIGTTNDSVCVTVDPSGLSVGNYEQTVIYTVTGVVNNPQVLRVILHVEEGQAEEFADVTPDTLHFVATEGDSATQSLCAVLSSTNAPAAFTGTLGTGDNFISDFSDAGTTDDSVCVTVDPTGLSAGLYSRTVLYSVDGVSNNPQTLFVTLTIEEAQGEETASVTPDTLFFNGVSGDTSLFTGCVYVTSTNAPANMTVVRDTSAQPFFSSISRSEDMTNDTVCVSGSAGGLDAGVYYNEFIVNVEGVSNNPQRFVVCVNVTEPAPSSILAISDTLFVFTSTLDEPFIGGDSLGIFNTGAGPNFGWQIVKQYATYTDTLNNTTVDSTGTLDIGVDISPLSGVTPGMSFISADNEGLDAGLYTCVLWVVADSGVQNSPRQFAIHHQVNAPVDTATVQILEVDDSLYHFTVTEGEGGTLGDSLFIFNTGDGPEFGWNIVGDLCYSIGYCGDVLCDDTVFNGIEILDIFPTSGVTPASVALTLDTDTLPAGEYYCTFDVVADSGVLNSPRHIIVHLSVLPQAEPSSDTLWVSTVPGTPGSKVKVPVNFINNQSVCGLTVQLEWLSSQIYLDSISFVGTRLEGISKSEVTIDNNLRTLSIDFEAVSFALPAGEGKIANLYFDIFSGISQAGVVPIQLNTKLLCPACDLVANNCSENYRPQFFPGGIVIDSSANVICGRVIDTAGNEIEDAIVQVWDFFPMGSKYATDTTGFDGGFKFNELYVVPYTLYAYADGYYPNTLEDINFGSIGLEIVLTPVSPVKPTNEWIDLYCDINTYMGEPLPVGSVVDAFDPDGDHVGTWTVKIPGHYGFMPVYRDDAFTEEDDGADPGDLISLYINGMPAEYDQEVIWTQNGDRFEVCLGFDGEVSHTCCLRNGWNLISWNVNTDIDDVDEVFADIMQYVDVILSFEEVGLTFDPDLPNFSTLVDADHLHGYWVRIENFEGECLEWDVSGLPVLVNTPIHLETGWNLVSYLPTVSLPTPAALVSQEGNLRVALGFDNGALTYEPSQPQFSTLNTMETCFGYWLKVNSPSFLVYPGFNSAPYLPEEPEDAPRGVLAKLGVAGQLQPTSQWMDIYSFKLMLDDQTVGAGTEVQVLKSDGSLVGIGVVEANGVLKFTPVYGEVDGSSAGLKSGETFTLMIGAQETNESFTYEGRGARLEIGALTAREGSVVLPNNFALNQNFPNPFNPSTKITFQLPAASHVTLEVFNVLGERVTVLADGMFSAGENEVIWNGRDNGGQLVSSGMYFYRMKSGAFVETRKMILLK